MCGERLHRALLTPIDLWVPPGPLFGPCLGNDCDIPIALFGNQVSRFVFADLSYFVASVAESRATPPTWELLHASVERDPFADFKYASFLARQFRPRLYKQLWRKPEGPETVIEYHRDRAPDVLRQFPSNSVSVFIHIGDGDGEGGSKLHFLSFVGREEVDGLRGMLNLTISRLANGALVVTDGGLADPRFTGKSRFVTEDCSWSLERRLSSPVDRTRSIFIWRVGKKDPECNN